MLLCGQSHFTAGNYAKRFFSFDRQQQLAYIKEAKKIVQHTIALEKVEQFHKKIDTKFMSERILS